MANLVSPPDQHGPPPQSKAHKFVSALVEDDAGTMSLLTPDIAKAIGKKKLNAEAKRLAMEIQAERRALAGEVRAYRLAESGLRLEFDEAEQRRRAGMRLMRTKVRPEREPVQRPPKKRDSSWPYAQKALPCYPRPIIDKKGERSVFMRVRYYSARDTKPGIASRLLPYIFNGAAVDRNERPYFVSNVGATFSEALCAFSHLEQINAAGQKSSKLLMHGILAVDHRQSPDEMMRVGIYWAELTLGSKGLPYAIVLHAPSPDGDERNWHMHIAYSYRPMEWVAEHEWLVGESLRTDLDNAQAMFKMREVFAAIMTASSFATGVNQRYTAKSNAARGLVHEPQEHLGSALTNLVRNGQFVAKNEQNFDRVVRSQRTAIDGELRQLDRQLVQERSSRQTELQTTLRIVARRHLARLRMPIAIPRFAHFDRIGEEFAPRELVATSQYRSSVQSPVHVTIPAISPPATELPIHGYKAGVPLPTAAGVPRLSTKPLEIANLRLAVRQNTIVPVGTALSGSPVRTMGPRKKQDRPLNLPPLAPLEDEFDLAYPISTPLARPSQPRLPQANGATLKWPQLHLQAATWPLRTLDLTPNLRPALGQARVVAGPNTTPRPLPVATASATALYIPLPVAVRTYTPQTQKIADLRFTVSEMVQSTALINLPTGLPKLRSHAQLPVISSITLAKPHILRSSTKQPLPSLGPVWSRAFIETGKNVALWPTEPLPLPLPLPLHSSANAMAQTLPDAPPRALSPLALTRSFPVKLSPAKIGGRESAVALPLPPDRPLIQLSELAAINVHRTPPLVLGLPFPATTPLPESISSLGIPPLIAVEGLPAIVSATALQTVPQISALPPLPEVNSTMSAGQISVSHAVMRPRSIHRIVLPHLSTDLVVPPMPDRALLKLGQPRVQPFQLFQPVTQARSKTIAAITEARKVAEAKKEREAELRAEAEALMADQRRVMALVHLLSTLKDEDYPIERKAGYLSVPDEVLELHRLQPGDIRFHMIQKQLGVILTKRLRGRFERG